MHVTISYGLSCLYSAGLNSTKEYKRGMLGCINNSILTSIKKIKNSILANDQPMSQWKKINLNFKKVANVLGM